VPEEKSWSPRIVESWAPLSRGSTDDEFNLFVKDVRWKRFEKQHPEFKQLRSVMQKASSSASKAGRSSFGAKIIPIESIRRPLTEWITRRLLTDVAAYFYDKEARKAIQERLSTILVRGGGPYVIVSHSLGTVIAYEVLHSMAHLGLKVPLWVTLGSPLGIKEVHDIIQKVNPKELGLVAPTVVARWSNFADRLDPVAVDQKLANDFAKTPPIEDKTIVNLDTRKIRGFNPHSALGYMGHPEVQKVVLGTVGLPFLSAARDFVLARDVAAELAGPPVRRPVLIQLSEQQDGSTLATLKEKTVDALREIIVETGDVEESQVSEEIDDSMRRFIGANLTPGEVERLLARTSLNIQRLWKDNRKTALMDVSTKRLQAFTAQTGYQASGDGIAWAVLDTGICDQHPHFALPQNVPPFPGGSRSLIVDQWNCCGNHRLVATNPIAKNAHDASGHGTHVAGIIAGQQLPGYVGPHSRHREIVSMAPRCRLHVYKVLDDQGYGQDSWIIKALDHIADVNEKASSLVIHGVNLSLGGPFDAEVFGCGHSPLCQELRRLWRMGVVVCIAAGNEGVVSVDTLDGGPREINLDLSVGDPANLEEAIAVGSVHKEAPHLYGVSYFSSRGPTADGRAKPDIVAPGEKIWSCNADFTSGEHYVQLSGTSMACPHVSGLVAAFLSVRREFIGRPDEVKRLLLQHCIDLGRDRYHQGAGLPNLVQMLAGT
jgi:subtilisin family serine protease